MKSWVHVISLVDTFGVALLFLRYYLPLHVGNITIIIMNSITAEEQHITCTDDLNNMHITCTEVEIDKCANCGKEDGSDRLKACMACKMVKYCNRDCQIEHRPKHKKACRKRAAELHDEELLKQPPPKEDCPICFLPLPSMDTGSKYKACCGKGICSGCIHAVRLRDNGVGLCPFCRTPAPTSEEELVKRTKKRVEVGDAQAMFDLGYYYFYFNGAVGLPRNRAKAMELYHRAGELGRADAYYNIGHAYYFGEGVEMDQEKADHYYELAAMGGVAEARHNLGCDEDHAGNWDRAIKHYMIAAGDGQNESVKNIQQMFMDGNATKEDYAKALRAYQKYLDEIRSEQRDQAAAFNDEYKCY